MGELLTHLVEWMAALPILWVYVLIFVVAYTENVVPPVPGDMIVVFGGYMVGIGRLNFVTVITLATVAGALGFMTVYAIGDRIGRMVFSPKRTHWLSQVRIKQVQALLDKWGYGLIAANRFLSGLRSVISLTVGMAHRPFWKTFLYCSLSALVWTSILVVTGYYVGDNWEVVREYLRNYGWFITVAMVFFVGALLWRRRLKKQRLAANPDAE